MSKQNERTKKDTNRKKRKKKNKEEKKKNERSFLILFSGQRNGRETRRRSD